eukprot:443289-Amphidinium_carterae.1
MRSSTCSRKQSARRFGFGLHWVAASRWNSYPCSAKTEGATMLANGWQPDWAFSFSGRLLKQARVVAEGPRFLSRGE